MTQPPSADEPDPFAPPSPGQPPPAPPPGQPPYGAPPPGQPPYGQLPPPYGQPPYGQPPYGQPQFGQPYGFGARGYASWLHRVGAYVIDGVVVWLPAFILIAIGGALESGNATDGGGGGTALVVIGYLVGIGLGIWNYVFRQGTTGQSLGKQALGIRLVRESDGQPIGAGMSFVRGLAHVVDSLACYIGWLWPLWDSKRQTFADKICSTVVVTG